MLNFFHGHPTIYRSKEIKKAICSKCSLFTPSPFPKFSTKLKISLPPQKRAPYSFEGKSSSQIKAFDLTREKLRRNTAKSKLMIASCRKAISGRNVFPASNSILLLQLNLIQKRCISFKEPYFMQKKRFWGIFSWNYSYAEMRWDSAAPLDCQSDSFHNHLNLFCLFNRYLYLDTIQTWHAFFGQLKLFTVSCALFLWTQWEIQN